MLPDISIERLASSHAHERAGEGVLIIYEVKMPEKFNGSIDELKKLIATAQITGEWQEVAGKYVFRSREGGILNWWESNKTIQYQGPSLTSNKLRSAVNNGFIIEGNGGVSADRQGKQIFIVHGHDLDARDQLELALHRMDLEPYILMNTSGEGKTIIEALEGKIGRDYSSDFGIVLMTPDDMGYAQNRGPSTAEPRARQNVVLETGMLLSSLTRDRIAIVVKGHIELPSDLEGIIRFGYNEHIKEIVPKLCKRLKEAGFELNSDKIMHASQ